MKRNKLFTTIQAIALLFSMIPVGFAQSDEAPVGFSIKNMDLTVDPRKDFPRYAMGGWLDRTSMRDDQLQVLSASWLMDTLDERLLEIAQNAASAKGPEKTGEVQLVGDFYTSAMDTKTIDSLGIKPLHGILREIDGARDRARIARLAARLRLEFGSSPFMGVSIGPDRKNNKQNILSIESISDDRGFGLNQNEYLSEGSQQIRDRYRDYVATLLRLSGETPERASKIAEKFLSYEIAAAKSSLTPTQRSDPNATYNKITPAELKAMVPAFDFDSFFAGLGVKMPQTLIVDDPGALKGVQEWLATTSNEDLRAYLRAHVIRKSAGLIGGDFLETAKEYSRVKSGLPQLPPREKDTVDTLGSLMAHPLSKLYVKKYFKPEQKKAVDEMMGLIRAEFKKRIQANDWLSDSTKKTALAKLERIRVMVGYPANESDWIDYSSVRIKPDDFFGNIIRLREFRSRLNLAQLGKPVEVDQFTVPGKVTPISMNAAIHQLFLAVYVTAAFINPPYYVASNDAAANFGSLGAVVGHELTHAFDSKGRNYDTEGNLRDWWTPEDAARFNEKASKLVAQYNGYEVAPGLKVNGQLTLSENIADLGGLTLGYNALQTYMAKNGRLPDVNGISPEQRFFIAWAQTWMAKTRVEGLKILVATDPHSPSEVRSYGPAVNMDEFFTAFNIKRGDPMWRDPKDRVTIW